MQHWLNESEVRDLTRRSQPAAQARVLAESGIPFRMVDNRPVVVRSDVQPPNSKSRSVILELA